jgi:lipoprotein-anchoring transpeptidase ErfK/SrfK
VGGVTVKRFQIYWFSLLRLGTVTVFPTGGSQAMTRVVSLAGVRRASVALVAVATLALAGCQSGDGEVSASGSEGPSASAKPTPESAAEVSTNVDDVNGPVTVDTMLEVSVQDGSFDRVTVRAGSERLRGSLSGDDASWKAKDRLEPGVRYRVTAVAVDDEGLRTTEKRAFRTEDLPLERQTYPSIAPLQGETVGVGMPVIVKFDVPVTDRASIERHLDVHSTPSQAGTWHWVNDREVHWRPRKYWKAGTHVVVDADVNSIPAGNGVYGQVSREVSFEVGDSIVSKVDVAQHRMRVFVNGALSRTMPISAGKPGFITRSGTKVIIEKTRDKVMDAATIGIPKSSPEYYKLDVKYAMRVTYSGEFLHAAPWSEGSQGVANVSHGCVGMTTDNASWLFNLTHERGDVVEVTGSERQMTLDNGYGDWNASFQDYAAGSALN